MVSKSTMAVVLLLRQWRGFGSKNPSFLSSGARGLSSSESLRKEDGIASTDDCVVKEESDLRRRIFQLRFPKRSVTEVMDRWVKEGGKVNMQELRQITTQLKRAERYKHALEICEWMINTQKPQSTDCDYAVRVELINKVFGVGAAEEFFKGIPSTVKSSETYTALLHSFAGRKLIEKAEELFENMKELNIGLNALTFNEMMTLYMSVGQQDKVPLIIEEMKDTKICPDLYTYNLWVSACAASTDFESVQRILNEMSKDANSNASWTTYRKLTNIYVNAGCFSNTENSLIHMGEKNSVRDWITYDFLIILQASLGNKDKLTEIWKSLQVFSQKMSRRNYICLLSSFLVMEKFKEVGDIIEHWKRSRSSSFDISACHSLSDALSEAGYSSVVKEFQQFLQKNS